MECDDFCLGIEVLKLIEEMQLDSARPDYVTFVNVLSGCSHTGLVGRGWEYIKLMSNKFGEAPRVEHHACMVDLLGEAGKLYEAKNLLNQLQLRMVQQGESRETREYAASFSYIRHLLHKVLETGNTEFLDAAGIWKQKWGMWR
ncbi:pentatricopeptide repeat-containing At2g33680 [Olea europaea subsp. europaea]|uniref:Pentatricopeptide repeat-containing At2g33680 n=1 Tax=Olea europaea subsp. europaea TaxID=158383 RepID=A0A8S0RVJ8_OLEEU|nr:pentatricopeptide repeat-containing At2g33680 [Olea europaea subsp. europaea]